MLRKLVLALTIGASALAVAPAADAAVKLYCYSVGNQCASWSCPAGYDEVVDTGTHTGPWLVVCAPYVP